MKIVRSRADPFSIWLLLLCFGDLCIVRPALAGGPEFNSTTNDYDEDVAEAVQDFMVGFHRTLESRRIREKRSSGQYHTIASGGGLVNIKLSTKVNATELLFPVSPDQNVMQRVHTWSWSNTFDDMHLFWSTRFPIAGGKHHIPRLSYGRLQPTTGLVRVMADWPDLAELNNSLPIRSRVFRHDYVQYIVYLYRIQTSVADHEHRLVTYRLRSNDNERVHFVRMQSLRFVGRTDIDLVKLRDRILLAVCVQRTEPSASHGELRLYEWNRLQFDLVSDERSELLSGIVSVRLFVMSSTVYMATAPDPRLVSAATLGSERKCFSNIYLHQAGRQSYAQLRYVQKLDLGQCGASSKITHAATRLRFVSVHSQYYLLVAGFGDVKLFWFGGNQFVEYQTLPHTSNAIDLAVTHLPNNEALLGVATTQNELKLFTESIDGHYVQTYEQKFDLPLKSVDLLSFRRLFYFALLTFDNETMYAPGFAGAPARLSHSPLLRLQLTNFTIQQQRTDRLSTCLNRLHHLLDERDQQVEQLLSRSNRVWVDNRPQVINSPLLVHGSVMVNGQTKIDHLQIGANSWLPHNITLKALNAATEQAELHLQQQTNQSAYDVAYRDMPDQTVIGPIRFASPVSAAEARLTRVTNPTVIINQVPFTDLVQKTARLRQDQLITGHWTFLGNLTAHDVHVPQVNQLLLSDVLLSKSSQLQTISGRYEFNQVRVNQLELRPNGLINEINLDQLVLANTNSSQPQVVTGLKHFDELRIRQDLPVAGLVNGGDIRKLAQHAIPIQSNRTHHIQQKLSWRTGTAIFADIHTPNAINNQINLTEMAHFGLSRFGRQTITGRITMLGPMTVNGAMEVTGRVNNVDLARDVLTTNTDQRFNGELVFEAPTLLDHDLMAMEVNGKNLSEEVVYRNVPPTSAVPQVITAHKTFVDDITVQGNLTLDAGVTLDLVDPSELVRFARNPVDSAFGAMTFENLHVTGNVHTRHSVGGIPLDRLIHQYWMKSFDQKISVPVHFNAPASASHVNTTRLNSYLFPGDFFVNDSPSDQEITAPKSFADAILDRGGLRTLPRVPINGIDLNRLADAFVRNRNRRDHLNRTVFDPVSGHKQFTSIEVKGNLIVDRFNGLDLNSDILLARTINAQTVTGSKVWNATYASFGSLNVNQNVFVPKSIVNSINVDAWQDQLVLRNVPLNQPVRPLRNKNFVGGLSARQVQVDGTVNSLNWTQLQHSVVTLSDDQVIEAPLVFQAPVQLDRLESKELNGVPLDDFLQTLVFKDRQAKPLVLSSLFLTSGNLSVDGRFSHAKGVNSIDLRLLRSQLASKSRPNVFRAPITVRADVQARQMQLDANVTLNHVRLDELIRLTDNVTFTGHVHLADGLQIQRNLHLKSGWFNRCNVRDLIENVVTKSDATRNGLRVQGTGSLVFKRLEVIGEVQTRDDQVNGINLRQMERQIFSGPSELSAHQVLRRPVTFGGPVTVGNLVLHNVINDVDVSHIQSDAVRRSRSQFINGSKILVAPLDLGPAGTLLAERSFRLSGTLNQVNLVELNRTLVRSNQPLIELPESVFFNRPVVFEQDLQSDGDLNGIRIPHDLYRLNANERPNATIRFESPVQLNTDLIVTETFDGVRVQSAFSDTIDIRRSITPQPIRSRITFNDPLKVDRLIVRRSINGVPINQLLPNDEPRVLRAHYSLQGPVIATDVHFGPNAYLNRLNLSEIDARTVRLNRPDHIGGNVLMHTNLTVGPSFVERLNDIDLKALVTRFEQSNGRGQSLLAQHRSQVLQHQHQLSQQINAALAKSATLDYFELFDEFESSDEDGRPLTIDRFVTAPIVLRNPMSMANVIRPAVDRVNAWRSIRSPLHSSSPINRVVCERFETIQFEVKANGDLVRLRQTSAGRLYPSIRSGDSALEHVIWTNTSACTPNSNRASASLYEVPNEVTELRSSWSASIGHVKRKIVSEQDEEEADVRSTTPHLDRVSNVMSDARFFRDSTGRHFAFVTFAHSKTLGLSRINSTLYAYRTVRPTDSSNGWHPIQQIPTFGATSMDIVHHSAGVHDPIGRTLLVIGNRLPMQPPVSNHGSVPAPVYEFDEKTEQFRLITAIATHSPSSVRWVPVRASRPASRPQSSSTTTTNSLLLLVANEKTRLADECSNDLRLTFEKPDTAGSSLMDQSLQVFTLSQPNNFTIRQTLPVPGLVSVDHFHLPPTESYVVAASAVLGRTYIYHWHVPSARLRLVQTIRSPGVRNVRPFWTEQGELYLMIASSKPGHSKRLRALITGPSPMFLSKVLLESSKLS